MIYDLVIVGGGPAGTAAAVYAARKQLKTLIIAAEFGGQSSVSENIFNWIGTPEISGADLAKNFKSHVMAHKGEFLDVAEGVRAEKIIKTDTGFTVTAGGTDYSTKTILLTMGSQRRKLTIPGAEQFENKGITYCASCDGPVFAGQDVAVIGGGNAAFESAAQLLAYCKSVTLIHRSENFRADAETIAKLKTNPKLTIITNAELLKIEGNKFVSSLTYKDTTTGEEKTLPITGVFVEVGQLPNTGFLKGTIPLDAIGRIEVDPRTQETKIPGIWAAGDATDGLYHQNNIAAGDAVKALEDLYLWLRTK